MSDESPGRPRFYVAGGRVVPPGKLVRLGPGRWVEPVPARCWKCDHPLAGTGRTETGWVPCMGDGRTGHRTHRCESCDTVTYTPPRDKPECACERRERRKPPR
ncbi:hypothetical protein [Nocardia nova]